MAETAADSSTIEETLLVDRLARIADNPAGYFAVHVHLSELRPNNKQQNFISIAARVFENLISTADAILFRLSNGDLVLICREVPVDDIDPYIEKVRSLFSEDPLTATETDEFEDRFTTWYDLAHKDDLETFRQAAQLLADAAEKAAKRKAASARDKRPEQAGEPIGALNLAALVERMKQTRVADLIRQQAAVQIGPKGAGTMVFREHFVSIGELKERVAPQVNLFASAWLFQYLTEVLDRRLLAVMARKDYAIMRDPISLNLNVGTVMSRDFQQFNRAVGEHTEKVVIEMQLIDIFTDITAFNVARDTLQRQGYRVVVDGLNPMSLQFFDPSDLKTDFIKIAWGAGYGADGDDARARELAQVVKNAGRDSVILARVDSEDAVRWGLKLGISRFQGYFIDKLVTAMAQKSMRGRERRAAGS